MKFQQAFDIYYDRMKAENVNFKGFSEETAKAMVSAWNVVAIAENTLDDLVILDQNNNIISLPLNKSTKRDDVNEEKEQTGTKRKGQKPNNGVSTAE